MEKMKFQLNNALVNGDLDLENRCIILDLSIHNSMQKELYDRFFQNHQFDIFGEFDDNARKISALKCNVIDPRPFGKTKIDFLQLYIGDIHMEDSEHKNINKALFQISYVNNLPSIDSLIIQDKFALTILNV